jgi:hypothetical protein
MAAADAEHSSGGGGILGAFADMASKLFGGGGALAALAENLGHMGLSADQIKNFVPQMIGFLKSKLPPDVLAKISHHLPAEEAPSN